MQVTESVKKACVGVVDGLGLDLVDVTYAQEFGIWELTLFIKNKSGEPITHKVCERVTRAVDDILDDLDPTNGQSYSLSVASLGIK